MLLKHGYDQTVEQPSWILPSAAVLPGRVVAITTGNSLELRVAVMTRLRSRIRYHFQFGSLYLLGQALGLQVIQSLYFREVVGVIGVHNLTFNLMRAHPARSL